VTRRAISGLMHCNMIGQTLSLSLLFFPISEHR
jgi:hypothetical protein